MIPARTLDELDFGPRMRRTTPNDRKRKHLDLALLLRTARWARLALGRVGKELDKNAELTKRSWTMRASHDPDGEKAEGVERGTLAKGGYSQTVVLFETKLLVTIK